MEKTDALSALQQWYKAQCDGDWEHQYGVKIDTLDNPGWTLTIDLAGTGLEKKEFEKVQIETSEDEENWLICSVDPRNTTFEVACGPLMLNESIRIFLAWANA